MKKDDLWLLLDSAGFGGIESHVLELARGLVRHNIKVRVVFLKGRPDHPLESTLRRQRIPFDNSIQHPIALLRLLKRYSPDIIHTHGYKAGIVGRLLAKFLGIRSVSTFHAGEALSGKLAFYDWLDRHSAFLADKVFTISPTISAKLRTRHQLVNNFVDMVKKPLCHGENLAFVGRLSPEKGPDIFCRLASAFPERRFSLYGDGDLCDSLQATAPCNVHFRGYQSNMAAVWPEVDILVLTSRYEGLPMAALEAMAQGIPIIAFNVGALSSLIDHGVNGWLLAPGDTEGFSQAIQRWLKMDMGQKARYRANALKKVAHEFSRDAVLPLYLETYRSLTSGAIACYRS